MLLGKRILGERLIHRGRSPGRALECLRLHGERRVRRGAALQAEPAVERGHRGRAYRLIGGLRQRLGRCCKGVRCRRRVMAGKCRVVGLHVGLVACNLTHPRFRRGMRQRRGRGMGGIERAEVRGGRPLGRRLPASAVGGAGRGADTAGSVAAAMAGAIPGGSTRGPVARAMARTVTGVTVAVTGVTGTVAIPGTVAVAVPARGAVTGAVTGSSTGTATARPAAGTPGTAAAASTTTTTAALGEGYLGRYRQRMGVDADRREGEGEGDRADCGEQSEACAARHD